MCSGIGAGRLAVTVLSLGGLQVTASDVLLGSRPLFGGRGGEGLDKDVPLVITWESSAISELLFLLTGLGGGTGGCLAGAVLVVLVGAVVLALAGAGNRVLGAGEGAAVELTVFAAVGAVLKGAVLAVLLAGIGSFVCTSFASWEVEGGLFGGSTGCLGTCGS